MANDPGPFSPPRNTSPLNNTGATLESLQAWLAALMESSSDAIVSLAPDGVVLSWNAAAERLFGYAPAEIVGRSVAILYPPERAQELAQLLARFQQGEQIRDFATERLTKARTRVPVVISFSPVLDTAGQVKMIACTIRDHSAHKQSEDYVRFQVQLLDAVDRAVIATDIQGRILFWNRYAEQLYGWAAAEVVGRPILTVTPTEMNQAQAGELLSALQRGEHWSGEFWVQHRDGRRFLAEVSDSPIVDGQGQVVGIVGISHDITARKHQEQELEQRVLKRTAQWQTASESLRRLAAHLQRTREDERAHIARDLHDDLGQMLTVVKLELGGLERKLVQDPASLQFSRAEVLQQLRLIQSKLDETMQSIRVLIRQLRPEFLDEMGLAAALASQAEQFQARSGIVCQFTTDGEVVAADPERTLALYRIAQESLTNAARHAGATRLTVSLRQSGDWLFLQVSDNGRGISPADLHKADHFGVLGMRERVVALGGEFSIEGSAAQGTTVSVKMPMT